MIKVDHLTRVFQTEDVETTALAGISFEIEAGEFVSIMGPSGCGKSTLLNILGILDTPNSGTYQLLGQDVAAASERQRMAMRKDNIGFVFQSFNLIEELTIYQNVALPLVYLKVPRAQQKTRVHAILERFGLMARANHYPIQLSGGQQQRCAVARAVVTNPRLILADEPTGNLDSGHGKEVMLALSELNREGTTIVMVTHSEIDADFGRRIIRLFDGSIVSENLREV